MCSKVVRFNVAKFNVARFNVARCEECQQLSSLRRHTARETSLLFLAGAGGANSIAYLFLGAGWQSPHTWWLVSSTSLLGGMLTLWLRREFEKTLVTLLGALPWQVSGRPF